MEIDTNNNSSPNSTNRSDKIDNDDEIMLSITLKISILVLIMLFAFLGNFLLVTSIIKSSRMRKSMTNLLILNLALCDILIVTSSVLGEILSLAFGQFPLGALGCHLLYPVSTYAVIAAVSTLMLICIDRFIATNFPFRYRWLKSRSKYALMLAHAVSLCCVIPYSLHLRLAVDQDGIPSCNEQWSKTSSVVYTIFLFFIEYAVPLPIVISLYTRTWMQIKQQNDDIIRDAEHRRRTNKPLDEEEVYKVRLELIKKFSEKSKRTHLQVFLHKMNAKFHVKKKEEFSSQIAVIRHNQTVHMLKLFICIVLVFAIFMLPNQIIWLYNTLHDTSIGDVPETVAYWLTYTNSVFNPIIYGIHPKFRKVYYNNFKDLLNGCADLCSTNVRRRLSSRRATTTSRSFTTGTDNTVNFAWTPDVPRRRKNNERSIKERREGVTTNLYPPVENSTDSLLTPASCTGKNDFAWTPDIAIRRKSHERTFKQRKRTGGTDTINFYTAGSSTDSLLAPKEFVINLYGSPKKVSSGSIVIPAITCNINNYDKQQRSVNFVSKIDIVAESEDDEVPRLSSSVTGDINGNEQFYIIVDKICLEQLKSLNETDC